MSLNEHDRCFEKASTRCREWFGIHGKDFEQDIHLLFPEVKRECIRAGFKAIQREGIRHFTGVVWVNPAAYDYDCTGIDECVDGLEKGSLLSMSMNYEVEVGELTLDMLITLSQYGLDDFVGRGYTEYRFFNPREAPAREKFDAFLGHGLDLQVLFGARELHVGPDRKDDVRDLGTSWVGV